jgi:plasmid stability protein
MVARNDPVAQIVVRKLPDNVKRQLQQRARRHGRSMEEEVRDILRDALKDDARQVGGLGTAIAAIPRHRT